MESSSLDAVDKRGSVEDAQSIHLPEKEYTSADAEQLAQLGHTQTLERNFSLVSAASMCMCLLATWEAVSSVLSAALISGGAPCLFYN